MAAITWRNVDAPSFQGVSSMITGAQQSIDSGFNKFNELIKQRESLDTSNLEKMKQNNTQAFLDQLTQYRTPEELQAAQQSGALDQLRQQYGAMVDQAAIRGAEDARYGALQQRALTGIDYTNKTLAERYRPQTEAAMAGAALGKADVVASILQANPEMPGQDRIQAALVTAQRANDKFVLDQDTARAQTAHANAQAAAIPMNAESQRLQANSAAQSAKAQERKSLLDSITKADELDKTPTAVGVYKRGDMTEEGASESLAKKLKDAGVNPDRIANIVATASTYSRDGKFGIRDDAGNETRFPIPISVLEDGAMYANANAWFDSRAGVKMDDYLRKRLSDKNFQKTVKDAYDASKKAADTQKEDVAKFREYLFPGKK